MKYLLLALGLLITTPSLAADPKDVTAQYSDRDFSGLIKPRTQFLGFTGDYQKLDMVFDSVTHNAADPLTYHIYGHSAVGGVQTQFAGTLKVREIDQLDTLHFGVDDEMKDAGIRAQGTLRSDYSLQQQNGGAFTGTMTLAWYVNRGGVLVYDDIESESDGYSNNQYTGRWRAYPGSAGQTANWGEYRIPDSGDLDIGAAEFSANPKYHAKGW